MTDIRFSTGGAGLINLIKMFVGGHIVAGVFTAIATAAWVVQGAGNLFYYRQVRIVEP